MLLTINAIATAIFVGSLVVGCIPAAIDEWKNRGLTLEEGMERNIMRLTLDEKEYKEWLKTNK